MRSLVLLALVGSFVAGCSDSATPTSHSGLRSDGASAEDKATAKRVAQYITRNGAGLKYYEAIRLVRVENSAVTIETSFDDMTDKGKAYEVICGWIQGSDEADFESNAVTGTDGEVACPPRT